MKNLTRIGLVFVLVALLLSACAGPNYNLFGTWRETQSGSLIEFRQDGTMRIPQTAGTAEVNYIFSGQDAILIAPSPDTAADQMVKWNYTIVGDTLTIKLQAQDQTTGQATQQNVTLKRVK
jgi:hypothetical protein